MESQVVAYQLDDSSLVKFEIDPPAGFRPAGAGKVPGRVQDAVAPAIEAAKVVLAKAREASPEEVEVTFGIKVTGGVDWLIARAASEANFEIKMTWRSVSTRPPAYQSVAVADGQDKVADGQDKKA